MDFGQTQLMMVLHSANELKVLTKNKHQAAIEAHR